MEALDASSRPNEVTPRFLRKLEIGTANGGVGVRSACPGYDPRKFEPGTEITTVDLLSRFKNSCMRISSYMWRDYLIDSNELKDVYNTDHMWFVRPGDELPRFTHTAVVADGRELPFADTTFGQALMTNVIGDPWIDDDSAQRLIREALRVSDELMIVEDCTPHIAAKRFIKPQFAMKDITTSHLAIDAHSASCQEYTARNAAVRSSDKPHIYVLTKNERWGAPEERLEPAPQITGAPMMGKLATVLASNLTSM